MDYSLSEDERRLMNLLVDRLILMHSSLSPEIEAAFRTIPRRVFLEQFYEGTGEERTLIPVRQDEPDLPTLEKIYTDRPLVTRYEDGLPASSTTQPVVMAEMLFDLDLRPGLKVLEIGAGTGWNAAIMATLVGDSGLIYSIDIQPDVAEEAQMHLARAGFAGVHVRAGDGGYGWPAEGPFDRIITTAGCPDVSPHWAEQLAEGGVLLVLLKLLEWGDPVLRLTKRKGRLTGRFTRWCGFMKLRGDYSHHLVDSIPPEASEELLLLLEQPLGLRPLPWEGAADPRNWTVRSNFSFFLSLADPRALHLYPRFSETDEILFEGGVGLLDLDRNSLAVLHRDRMGVYGHEAMALRVQELYQEWMRHRAPHLVDYAVRVYLPGESARRPPGGWLMKRRFARFGARVARR
jgi:protein-L-isoaspartate(D-aspartate) O-methyltransferase